MKEYSIMLANVDDTKNIEDAFSDLKPKVSAFLDKENVNILLAKKGNHIIGISIVEISKDDLNNKTGNVVYLNVLKDYLSRGIINGLLLRSELIALEQCCKKLFISYQNEEKDLKAKGFNKLADEGSGLIFLKYL